MKFATVIKALHSIPTKSLKLIGIAALSAAAFSSCSSIHPREEVVVSVKDQRMALLKQGEIVKTYPVSTSKFGLGNSKGSGHTPLGKMVVAKKIGGGAPAGAVFKSRKRTGEIIKPNAPGRDPIVTRIMWLKGMEFVNRNTFSRYIYIHGTPEEKNIGRPASYGCIRMKSKDVIDLYKRLNVGSEVQVVKHSLDRYDDDDNS